MEKVEYDGSFSEMAEVYRKMDLSEEEIAKRILCKTTRVIERSMDLNECDQK